MLNAQKIRSQMLSGLTDSTLSIRHAWTKREINVPFVFLVSPKKFPVFVKPSMRALSNQPPGPRHQKQPTQAVSGMMKSMITFRSMQILILLIMGQPNGRLTKKLSSTRSRLGSPRDTGTGMSQILFFTLMYR